MRPGLPKVPVPLAGILNGGYEYEFYSYARMGERIVSRSRYKRYLPAQGKSGPMVMVLIEDEFATSDGRPAAQVDQHANHAVTPMPTM